MSRFAGSEARQTATPQTAASPAQTAGQRQHGSASAAGAGQQVHRQVALGMRHEAAFAVMQAHHLQHEAVHEVHALRPAGAQKGRAPEGRG